MHQPQVAATAICIQSTLIRLFNRRKSKGAPTSASRSSKRKQTPLRLPETSAFLNPVISMDACCANYCPGENHCVLRYKLSTRAIGIVQKNIVCCYSIGLMKAFVAFGGMMRIRRFNLIGMFEYFGKSGDIL